MKESSGKDGIRAAEPRIAVRHASPSRTTAKEISMYDQSTLSEIIRFARVDAGCAVIDVYPGAGDWTRLFSDVVGPNGRVSSFVPTEIADLKHDQVGRIQTIAKEFWPREHRCHVGGSRGYRRGHETSRCPVAAPVLPRFLYQADPGRGARRRSPSIGPSSNG